MKTLAACLLIYLALGISTASTAVRRESCGCSAKDGSCMVSGSCPRGCLAFCPSGNCRVFCVNGGSGANSLQLEAALPKGSGEDITAPLYQETKRGFSDKPGLSPKTSLNAQYPSHADVKNISTSPFSIQSSRESSEYLQAIGRVLLSGERTTVCVGNVSAIDLANALSSLTGLKISVDPEDADVIIRYSGKDVTLEEILSQVSKDSGVRFSVK